jgi:hypothetical protein
LLKEQVVQQAVRVVQAVVVLLQVLMLSELAEAAEVLIMPLARQLQVQVVQVEAVQVELEIIFQHRQQQ